MIKQLPMASLLIVRDALRKKHDYVGENSQGGGGVPPIPIPLFSLQSNSGGQRIRLNFPNGGRGWGRGVSANPAFF